MDSGSTINKEQFNTVREIEGKLYIELDEAIQKIQPLLEVQTSLQTVRNALAKVNQVMSGVPKALEDIRKVG